MFRDDPLAFATDALACHVAKEAIEQDFDLQVGRAAQEFFYMPLEHSEDIKDQILQILFTQQNKTLKIFKQKQKN